MKYRLVKRARGWVIQRNRIARDEWKATGAQFADYSKEIPGKPVTVAAWRWHWVAALHLLWLRERARK